MKGRAVFTEQDLRTIEEAVREAETGTSGEIVPVIVASSDTYERTMWKGSAFGGFVCLTGAVFVQAWVGWWPTDWVLSPVGLGLAGLLAGALLPMIAPPVRRLLAGRQLMHERCDARARRAFLDDEVFATRDRTGILIFVSLFEQRVIVLADSGIRSRVGPEAWDDVVQDVLRGIERSQAAGGIVDAIRRAAAILRNAGVGRSPDDRDELPNRPRMPS